MPRSRDSIRSPRSAPTVTPDGDSPQRQPLDGTKGVASEVASGVTALNANGTTVVPQADNAPSTKLARRDGQRFTRPAPPASVHTDLQHLDRALVAAAMLGHDSKIQALIAQGANVHAQGDRAVRVAAGSGRISTVERLIAHGADLRARQDDALMQAAEGGHDGVVRLLLLHGANLHTVQRRTDVSHNALSKAAREGHEGVVRTLLDHGADLTALDFSAIKLASLYARPQVLIVLLDQAQAQGTSLPLNVLTLAAAISGQQRTIAQDHAKTNDLLKPLLIKARIEHERAVLLSTVEAVDAAHEAAVSENPTIKALRSRSRPRL